MSISEEYSLAKPWASCGSTITYTGLVPTPERPKRTTQAGARLFEAAADWLETKRSKSLLPKTLECAEGYVRQLKKFFGDIPLAQFDAGSVKAYQLARSAGAGVFADEGGDPQPVGASAVNHEVNALQQILRRAGLWKEIADYYSPLKEPEWKPPRTFTTQEQRVIFERLSTDPAIELADIVFRITRNTTASGCELRGLRLRNLELDAHPPRVHIPPDATKNDIRPRTIPLNAEALAAFQKAVARAERLGSTRPHNYLFPYRVNRKLWDPNRPASPSWLRKQTQKMRDATGIDHLRPHAFRHLAVTELLESGAPEQTVVAVAGWVSRQMIQTYSHARIEAKAAALKMLERRKPRKRRKQAPAESETPNVLQFPIIKGGRQ